MMGKTESIVAKLAQAAIANSVERGNVTYPKSDPANALPRRELAGIIKKARNDLKK